ncbi:hypothetical protein BRC93_15870 [Halobacteriales archaeon QS_5_70_15]|nr:MAG: hypothetical protein BRC93_15870 [Halobacteriales archaeon QS_5_70_15]
MDMKVERLAKYPTESEEWIKTVATGGAAMIFSFLVVPLFLVAGYLVRAIRAGMDGAEEPPVFDGWGELLKEGLIASVIGFVYQLVPLIVFAVFVGGSILAFLTGSDAGAGAGVFGLIGGAFAAWILFLVFGYVGFAGVANYARERSFAAGFDFGVISDVVTSKAYLMAWVYVILMNIVVAVIVGLLNIVPFLGGIVGLFVSFYALIIAGWLWGNGFAEATGTSVESARDTGAAAV